MKLIGTLFLLTSLFAGATAEAAIALSRKGTADCQSEGADYQTRWDGAAVHGMGSSGFWMSCEIPLEHIGYNNITTVGARYTTGVANIVSQLCVSGVGYNTKNCSTAQWSPPNATFWQHHTPPDPTGYAPESRTLTLEILMTPGSYLRGYNVNVP